MSIQQTHEKAQCFLTSETCPHSRPLLFCLLLDLYLSHEAEMGTWVRLDDT